ncbi:MAG: PBP1A family penicillin-binding protein [Agathobacter sp.]|nr:PBP1A family penicillin-binding protein [Agathobacter sp.]
MTKQKKKKKQKKHRVFWFFVKIQVVLILLVLGAIGYYFGSGYAEEVEALQKEARIMVMGSTESDFVPAKTSTVYDSSGNLIQELQTEVEADYVEYEDIPALFVDAVISIEDKKFYSHKGVDYKAIVRAALDIMDKKKITQGGSTITMQLAKLMYLEHSTTWQYKVQQMFVAMELEKRYSKTKIMEFYLNNIYFSNGYYGIQAACRGYFNCELGELSVSEIAFLCAIPNSPLYYDPLVYPEHTLERRDRILKNMYEDGVITEAEYEAALAEEIVLNPAQSKGTTMNNYVDTYTYYCATRALMENEGFQFQYYFESEEEEEAYNEAYSQLYEECRKKLYTGGYKIYTTFDMEKQELLQQAVDSELASFTEVGEDGVYKMQGSAVCIDNTTSYVVAIVGGRDQDFSTYTLNRAYQSHRQPGSSIKPLLVYTPIFEKGYSPDTVINDHELKDGPENSTGRYYGDVTLRFAVEHSLNTIAWQLYELLSPEVGLSYLKKMNFSDIRESDKVLATALGGFTTGMSALEMASGYATLVNDGVYREPTCIEAIIDSDENLVYVSRPVEKQIYDKTAARMMTDVLKTTMESGTARNMKLENMPCAGKTGTTNSHKDGWFVGYTRYYTTSVWVGCDMPQEIEDLSGNTYPGRIWKNYMEEIHADLPAVEFLPYAQLSEEFQQEQQAQQEQQQQERQEANQQGMEGQTGGEGQEQEQTGGEQGQTGEQQEQEQTGGEQTGEGQGQDQAGGGQTGENQGQEQAGAGQGQEQTGGEQTGDQAGGGQTGQDQAGEGQTGEQTGGEQTGQDQAGGDQAGDGQEQDQIGDVQEQNLPAEGD